ncbi:ribonuclease E activity regulator RraA, partial [Pseudoalteromonas sp. S979]
MVAVLEPMFIMFGGRHPFGGGLITVKCFDINEVLREIVSQAGCDEVLL